MSAVVRAITFSPEEKDLIRRKYMANATNDDFEEMILRCESKGLNPLLGECYIQGRLNKKSGATNWAFQVAIDGFRKMAEETRLYDGQDEPEYILDSDGRLTGCKVRVYRKDISRPFVGVAYFDEYVQKTWDGEANQFWGGKPRVMIAKCAEASAFRKAFPGKFEKTYEPAELIDDESDGEGADGRQKVRLLAPVTRPAALRAVPDATTTAPVTASPAQNAAPTPPPSGELPAVDAPAAPAAPAQPLIDVLLARLATITTSTKMNELNEYAVSEGKARRLSREDYKRFATARDARVRDLKSGKVAS